MEQKFRIEKKHTEIASKSTIQKALTFLKTTELEPPYLLTDKAKVRQKVHSIGRNIRNCEVYYAVKANPDIEVLKLIDHMGIGFEIASEGELAMLVSMGVHKDRIITSRYRKESIITVNSFLYGMIVFFIGPGIQPLVRRSCEAVIQNSLLL